MNGDAKWERIFKHVPIHTTIKSPTINTLRPAPEAKQSPLKSNQSKTAKFSKLYLQASFAFIAKGQVITKGQKFEFFGRIVDTIKTFRN